MQAHNYIKYNDIHISRRVFLKSSKPILGKLDIELTERCNYNCIHCYINLPYNDVHAEQRELSTDAIKRILIETVSLGCLSVRFTGGEPLLRKDFEELYVFTRRLGIKVLLFTNAALVTPDLAELFSRIPPLENIEVSIYGMKKSSWEAVTRVPGSYETAQRGINLLLKYKIPFIVKSAFLPPNKCEIDAFETWTSAIPWMYKPLTYSMFFDLRCRRDAPHKNGLIKKLRVMPEEGVGILARNKYYLPQMRQFCAKFLRLVGDTLFPCAVSYSNGACVDAYGYFQPCLPLRHPDCIYDIKRGLLKDALTNFLPQVRKMKASNPEYLSRCARCFLKRLCEQCPAKSWMEHGTLDTPVEYFCDVAHAQARYFGLIEENEWAWEVTNWQERIGEFSGKEPACVETTLRK